MSNEEKRLRQYKIADEPPLYFVGCFDKNVTVRSQQIRSLNLAFCLIETASVPTSDQEPKNIAIVGAGFAGLTLAAALLRKQVAAKITLFEERDTLLPLQQGSDSRWLHPHIYDWPAGHSDASAAMLPVLNWTAARASDVVVQILSEWRSIVTEASTVADGRYRPRLFCNTRHLQIAKCVDGSNMAQVEWVGEERTAQDGHGNGATAVGASEKFHLVVMAVGFGLERRTNFSYWRNETLGQPSLAQSRSTYLVSGQGDGAMIDLQRLRISQYRQDRILEELFHDKSELAAALRVIKRDLDAGRKGESLFSRFDSIRAASGQEWARLIEELRQRLRRDTDVVLHLKEDVRSVEALIEPSERRRMSFQNALLVFLLYKCGGFAPSTEKEDSLCNRLGIQKRHIVRRYGPKKRGVQIKRLLSEELSALVDGDFKQDADIFWKGGYFGYPGPLATAADLASGDKEGWRKEYLPGPTALAATVLCGCIAGLLEMFFPGDNRNRVTVHRAIELNSEPLLQQACEYAGNIDRPRLATAARTFPAEMATIGQAFASQSIIRSRKGISPADLQRAMDILNLRKAARDMRPEVSYVIAIPLLQPAATYVGASPVAGVVYIDSSSKGFWLEDQHIQIICRAIQQSLRGLLSRFDRIRNVRLAAVAVTPCAPIELRPDVRFALEQLSIGPPALTEVFQLNFDFSDLTPLIPSAEAHPT